MTVYGIDVSKWQEEMDWEMAAASGVEFAFIRAGSADASGPYTDYQFERNATITPYFMPVGYYWYLRPNLDVFSQAEYFAGLIESKSRPLGFVQDVEEAGGLKPGPLAKRIWDFVKRLNELLGTLPLNYSSPGFWDSYVAYDDEWAIMDLWLAQWNTDIPTPPRPWTDYLVWQRGQEPGHPRGAQSEEIDWNVWNIQAAPFPGHHQVYMPTVINEAVDA